MDEHLNDLNEAKRLYRISRYTTDHFRLRSCKRYVRVDVETDDGAKNGLFNADDCACGRSFQWHLETGIVTPNSANAGSNWSTFLDTITYPCNTFGKLIFAPGKGSDSSVILPGASAFYIRLGPSSKRNNANSYMESIYHLMTSELLWGFPLPQLIIEIIGRQRKLQDVDEKVLENFTKGLIRAANTAKAWIVTSGTNTGIMGVVGDAVSKSRMTRANTDITCIGITNWNAVNNRDQLVNGSDPPESITPKSASNIPQSVRKHNGNVTVEFVGMKPKPLQHGDSVPNPTHVYRVERPDNCSYGVPLNPGHDCFLFIDDGREKRFGEEIAFRAQFLQFLAQKTRDETGSQGVSTPPVLIVAGGGLRTLKAIEFSVASPSSLGKENVENYLPRPVVILLHFGGASDLLAFACELAVDKNQKNLNKRSASQTSSEQYGLPADFDDRIRNHQSFDEIAQFSPGEWRNEQADLLIKSVRNILKFRNLLTLVDLSDDQDEVPLDHAILNAVLRTTFSAPISAFSLALLWDRVDVAKQFLMRHESEISRQIDLKAALTRSIINGQNEVFQLLAESGLIDLNAYLTRYQIRFFYSEIFLKRRGQMEKAACVWLFRSFFLRKINEETMLSDIMKNPAQLQCIGAILSSLLGCYLDNVFTDEKSYKKVNDGSNFLSTAIDTCPYETSMRDLFLLQLLLDRNEFAVYIWKRGHDHLATALMAAIFLKSLAREANRHDMTDLGSAYETCGNEWRNRAISLLASCYEEDPIFCSRLLTRSLLTWQTATVLELAFYGNLKDFMEQPAVQNTLMQVWTGRLATFTKHKVIYLSLIPPVLPFLISRIRFEERTAKTRVSQPEVVSNSLEKALLGVRDSVGLIFPYSNVDIISPHKRQRDLKLTRVALFGCNKEGYISVIEAIYLLYTAPIAKYAVHAASCVAFLLLFLCFLLDGCQERGISVIELVIWICCSVFFLDRVRDGFGKTNLSVAERVQDFFSNLSVIAELASLSLVISAALVKVNLRTPSGYIYSHTIYTLACVIYWINSSRILLVSKSIGPKVITLFNMLRDLALFCAIYLLLLLSFSVPIHTLAYPHHHLKDGNSFLAMLGMISYQRMWNIFFIALDNAREIAEGTCDKIERAQVSPDAVNDNESTVLLDDGDNHAKLLFYPLSDSASNQTTAIEPANPTGCSTRNILAIILFITYQLLTYIMLLNMLVALFSYTIDKTRQAANRLWRFNMYRLLYEYYTRPVLPGPFMIFELAYRFLVFIYHKISGGDVPKNTDLKQFYANLDDDDYRKMEMFERSAAENVLSKRSQENATEDAVMRALQNSVERINARLDWIEARAGSSQKKRRCNSRHLKSQAKSDDVPETFI